MPDTASRQPRPAAERSPMSLRVATVAGIDIRIHASFLILVAIVAVDATAEEGPGLASGLAWLVALFACVVVHELAHSLVATHDGIPITEIELLPIGGISKMERLPEDPRVELRIAVVGPLASLGLGLAFGAVAALAGVSLWPPDLYAGAFIARLAWVNVMLAAFNLVPALPLDGGRVLRAALEIRTNREQATRTAAHTARIFASLMIAAGFLFNLWLMLIGVFVYFGAAAEERAATLHQHVKDVHVGDVMIRRPVQLLTHVQAGAVAEGLWRTAQREFPVVTADGGYVGLVTAAVLLRADPLTTVGELADRNLPTLDSHDPLETSGLLSGEVPVAAVVEEDHVVGLARASDANLVARELLRHPPADGTPGAA